jgi:hypothetical protein
MSTTSEPVFFETLGQKFFQQYMAKDAEVFQLWALEWLGYTPYQSKRGKSLPKATDLGTADNSGDSDNSAQGASTRGDSDSKTEEKNDSFFIDPDRFKEKLTWPKVTLENLPEYIYYAYIKKNGRKEFKQTHVQFKLQQENDPFLDTVLLEDFITIMRYTEKQNLTQVMVYIGDFPFFSPTKIKSFTLLYRYDLIDLTQIPLKAFIDHYDFHVQMLAIFNHNMPLAEKVRFIVEGMIRAHKVKGPEEAEFYYHLLQLTETRKNYQALDQIFDNLATKPEFKHLQRTKRVDLSPTVDETEERIIQAVVEKAATVMQRRSGNAMQVARLLDLKPVEYQQLLSKIEAVGGRIADEKSFWIRVK